MSEVKFHTKPTQINRQNPIKVLDVGGIICWLYYLPKNGYYVLFKVANSVSTASLAGFDENDDFNTLSNSETEIHTRTDLVNYFNSWNDLTKFDIVKIQEDILKMELEKMTQDLHTL